MCFAYVCVRARHHTLCRYNKRLVGVLCHSALLVVLSQRSGFNETLVHRQSEATDSEVLGRLCRMLCVLDKYHQFEYVLLQDSVRYFAAEGAQLVNAYDTARFLALVDRRLQVASVCRTSSSVCLFSTPYVAASPVTLTQG